MTLYKQAVGAAETAETACNSLQLIDERAQGGLLNVKYGRQEGAKR
jgi:hypothetical protein